MIATGGDKGSSRAREIVDKTAAKKRRIVMPLAYTSTTAGATNQKQSSADVKLPSEINGSTKIIERKRLLFFKTKQIFFSNHLFNIEGCTSVMFSQCKNKLDVRGFRRDEGTTSIIDLTQDLSKLWKKMHKTYRKRIRRAEREGVQVKINERYDEFYEIYKRFMEYKKIPGLLESLTTLKKYGTLLTAELDGELLGGIAYLENEASILAWFGCTTRFEVESDKKALLGNANRLIHWEAIKYAKQKGIKEYDMGGLFAREGDHYSGYSIDAFKKRFGGEAITVYTYTRDYNKIYSFCRRLGVLYLKVRKSTLFSVYRRSIPPTVQIE